jgi:glycerol uptake operon antiterminator
MKTFESFLASKLEYCILQSFHLAVLNSLCNMAHKYNKKCLVHIDLIKGIASDEYGAEFLCQNLKVDGLISIHPSVIQMAKKNKKLAIQRIFLIDSLSLEKSISLAKKTQPDYIEILPGIACAVVESLLEQLEVPLIGGGLIKTQKEIRNCLDVGLVAVTTSKAELWC